MRKWPLLLLGIGLSETVRLSGWRSPLSLSLDADAPPEALAALVRDVEREPEFVPGVRRVTVLERGGSANRGWVRYEVEGVTWGVRWRVRFRKQWEGDGLFVWWAEDGAGWPDHHGSLRLRPTERGTRMELSSRIRFGLLVLGGAGTLFGPSLFLKPTFRTWLRNLRRAVEGRSQLAD